MLLSDLKNPMSPTQAMPFNTHRSVLRLAMQALTQALGKLRAKMTHQEKENGGKGEDILVTLQTSQPTALDGLVSQMWHAHFVRSADWFL